MTSRTSNPTLCGATRRAPRYRFPTPASCFRRAGFHIDWDNLQQQVALPCGYYLQLNGGSASINGGEIELAGRVTDALDLRFGAGYEKTEIVNPGRLSFAGVTAAAPIQDVPAWTASLGAVYTQPLTPQLDGFVSADYSYTGNSVSLLNGGSGLYGDRPVYSLAEPALRGQARQAGGVAQHSQPDQCQAEPRRHRLSRLCSIQCRREPSFRRSRPCRRLR